MLRCIRDQHEAHGTSYRVSGSFVGTELILVSAISSQASGTARRAAEEEGQGEAQEVTGAVSEASGSITRSTRV